MTFEQKLNERFEDGKEEGIDQERSKTITKMIKKGFNDRMIMSFYETLTAEDIAVIRRQMAQASQ